MLYIAFLQWKDENTGNPLRFSAVELDAFRKFLNKPLECAARPLVGRFAL
jgi:hypothetical protein